MSLHIGIDIDDTLYDFMGTLIPHLNEVTGSNILFSEVETFKLTSIWDVEFDQVRSLVKENNLYQKGNISVDTVRTIKDLQRQGHTITFVTSRFLYSDYDTKKYTQEFLRKHGVEGKVIFTESKGITCKEEGINIFIDDALHNLKQIKEHSSTTKCLLVKKPWNGVKESLLLGFDLSKNGIKEIESITELHSII